MNGHSDFALKSPSFKDGDFIPVKFTCDGENINPFLEIKNIPSGTRSLILIMDDPDTTRGPAWDHWLLWNIPADTRYIEEDFTPAGTVTGENSWGKRKYGGPCPPPRAAAHRYVFRLLALDDILEVPENISKEELLKTAKTHLLAETRLLGRYVRK